MQYNRISLPHPRWRIYASVNRISIDSDNGLSPIRRQCWIIVNWTHRNKSQWNLNQNMKLLIHKKHLGASSAKLRPFYQGADELIGAADIGMTGTSVPILASVYLVWMSTAKASVLNSISMAYAGISHSHVTRCNNSRKVPLQQPVSPIYTFDNAIVVSRNGSNWTPINLIRNIFIFI